MEVRVTDKKYTPREIYKYTMDPEIKRMSDQVGKTLHVDGYVYYEDTESKTGEIRSILSIMSNGVVYATNSPTFRADFGRIIDICAGGDMEIGDIEVVSGTSKVGRTFVTCRLL